MGIITKRDVAEYMISKKIILVGDFSTGKTSLIRRFVDNQFSDAYMSTIGVKISKKSIALDNEMIQGLIWDIEGGTDKKPVNTIYLKGANGCILVADITRKETIVHIESYIVTVEKISPSIPFILVLNKSDKISDEEKENIFARVLEQYSEKTEAIFLSSAKSGEGVEEMFTATVRSIMAKEEH